MMRGRQNQTPNWRWLTAIAMCVSLLSGILISESAKAQNVVSRETASPKTALATYATDLTAAAEQGRFNSIEAKRELTDRALQVLASEQKNNPVVISESQAVRDVVVIGVAQRIVAGDVPENLARKHLCSQQLKRRTQRKLMIRPTRIHQRDRRWNRLSATTSRRTCANSSRALTRLHV